MTARRFSGEKLVIATHNPGKVKELLPYFGDYVRELLCAGELGLPAPDETGATFLENALIKAQAAAQASGLPALADDSGLSVYALNGAPGVYSADWGGPEKDFKKAMRRVHDELGASSDRRAFFTCVLAMAWPDGHTETAEGRVEGILIWPPRGENGFGYDSMFVAAGQTLTSAEMAPAQKQAVSHRSRALKTLIEKCFAPA